MVSNTGSDIASHSDDTMSILLVEDFDQLRNLSVRLLTGAGYQVIAASNGVEALTRFAAHQHEIQLLVTDLRMPQMGGLELVVQIRQRQPHLPVLLLSGYTSESVAKEAWALPDCRFLQKPCLPSELLAAVRAALIPMHAHLA